MLVCFIAQVPPMNTWSLDIYRKACNLDKEEKGGLSLTLRAMNPSYLRLFQPIKWTHGCIIMPMCVRFPFSSYFMSLHPISRAHIFHDEQVPRKTARVTLCMFFHFYLWLSCDIIHLFFILTFKGTDLSSFTLMSHVWFSMERKMTLIAKYPSFSFLYS